jgi:hypothetical protein
MLLLARVKLMLLPLPPLLLEEESPPPSWSLRSLSGTAAAASDASVQ